jgi:hypothetical protein
MKKLFLLTIAILFFISCKENKTETTKIIQVKDSISKLVIQKQRSNDLKYENYHNSTYGFEIDYPSEILFPQGESDSHDGQIFSSKNNENELRVYRSFIDVGEDSEIDLKVQFNKAIKVKPESITYKKLGKDFFVISGFTDKGQIYYQKTYLFERDLFTCLLTYNKIEKILYNKISEHIFESFKMPM